MAVGFGAQSLVKDIIAGLFIILENQYCVGDVAMIAGVSGTVEDINLRRTLLRDLDGTVHVVPNGEIRVASNLTKDWSRVNWNVSVAYDEDLERVMKIINDVGNRLAQDPQWSDLITKAPQVLRVDGFGAQGLDFKILGETKPASRRLKIAFDREGVKAPWPHTRVNVDSVPDLQVSPPSQASRRTGKEG